MSESQPQETQMEKQQQQSYAVAFGAVRRLPDRIERAHGTKHVLADSPEAAKREVDRRFEEMGCEKWITEVVERAD